MPYFIFAGKNVVSDMLATRARKKAFGVGRKGSPEGEGDMSPLETRYACYVSLPPGGRGTAVAVEGACGRYVRAKTA